MRPPPRERGGQKNEKETKRSRKNAAAAKAARDKAARDKAARDKAARDQAARDQTARDQAARDRVKRFRCGGCGTCMKKKEYHICMWPHLSLRQKFSIYQCSNSERVGRGGGGRGGGGSVKTAGTRRYLVPGQVLVPGTTAGTVVVLHNIS